MRIHAVLISLLVLCAGCSSVPEYTFDPDYASVSSVAVVPTRYDEELLLRFRKDQIESVDILTPLPVAKLFTLVAEDNREARFAKQVDGTTDVYALSLQEKIESVLEREGFKTFVTVNADDDDAPRNRFGLLKEIPSSLFGNADALLESASSIGFTAAGRGKEFKPTLWLTVRLTDADGNVRLYDQIKLNPPDGYEQGLIIYPSDRFVFDSQNELMSADRRSEALEYAVARVAAEFTYLVRGALADADQTVDPGMKVSDKRTQDAFTDKPSLDCIEDFESGDATPLRKKQTARQELDPALGCSWLAGSTSTPSALFAVPASTVPVEIEVATRLDADGTTAAHVATLDADLPYWLGTI